MHDIPNKVVVYDIKNKDLKLLTYFGMIQNYDKFSKWNAESRKKITHFEIFIFIQ